MYFENSGAPVGLACSIGVRLLSREIATYTIPVVASVRAPGAMVISIRGPACASGRTATRVSEPTMASRKPDRTRVRGMRPPILPHVLAGGTDRTRYVVSEGLRPSDSPTRALARRCAGSLRPRGSFANARSRCYLLAVYEIACNSERVLERRGAIIITGASRGIGAATARLAGERGYDVCVNFKSARSAADTLVAEIQASGRRAVAVQADVSVEADVVRLFETCDRELGQLTGLVNNAGILETQMRVERLDAARIHRILATNVVGAFICAREAVRRMSTVHGGKGGAIVNVSSGAARLGSPRMSTSTTRRRRERWTR